LQNTDGQAIPDWRSLARTTVNQAAGLAASLLVGFILLLAAVESHAAEPEAAFDKISTPIELSRDAADTQPGHRRLLQRDIPLDARIKAHIIDPEENCLRIDDEALTPAQIELKDAIRGVRQSAVGAELVEIAKIRGVVLCVDYRTELEAHYRSYLKLLGLNSRLDAAGKIVFLAHELAHVPQHPRFSNNRQFSPFDMLLLQRVREAAAEAIATRILWQLREAGHAAAWHAKQRTAYHDIAKSFEDVMDEVNGPSAERKATRSAFLRWFDADWRLDTYDDLMIRTLTRIAADEIGIVPTSRRLSKWFLRGIADYGRENFLQIGDTEALIERFRRDGLSSGREAALQAILLTSTSRPHTVSSETNDDDILSAVSTARGVEQ